MKILYHPHKPQETLNRKCKADDLYLHHRGLKCSNCGELVEEDVVGDDSK